MTWCISGESWPSEVVNPHSTGTGFGRYSRWSVLETRRLVWAHGAFCSGQHVPCSGTRCLRLGAARSVLRNTAHAARSRMVTAPEHVASCLEQNAYRSGTRCLLLGAERLPLRNTLPSAWSRTLTAPGHGTFCSEQNAHCSGTWCLLLGAERLLLRNMVPSARSKTLTAPE
jgi:hypothetical protein